MWSTRELAALAGTTEKAIRHYHHIGLLDEPERAANGYKQYRTEHLTRLQHITRLRGLGVPLNQVGAAEHSHEALRAIDEQLGTTIERLQRLREELALVLRHRAPLNVPPAFVVLSEDLAAHHHDLATIFALLWQGQPLDDLRTLVSERQDYEQAFESLPENPADETVEALAARMAETIRADHARFPWMRTPGAASKPGRQTTEAVLAQAFAEIYHPAQLRVLARAGELAAAESE